MSDSVTAYHQQQDANEKLALMLDRLERAFDLMTLNPAKCTDDHRVDGVGRSTPPVDPSVNALWEQVTMSVQVGLPLHCNTASGI
jgi:hypothetical protein